MWFEDPEDESRFREIWEAVQIARPVSYSLFTFGESELPYFLVCDKPAEGDTVTVCFIDHEPILIDLPASVVLEVTDAEEVVKGDTATNLQKTVTVSTGYTLKAPAHIKVGDKIKITTEDGRYSARAN